MATFRFKLKKLVLSMGLPLLFITQAYGKLYFNAQALNLKNQAATIDTTAFEVSNIAPGLYYSSIYVNGVFVGEQNIKYELVNNEEVLPVLNVEELERFGINVPLIIKENDAQNDISFSKLHAIYPAIKAEYDVTSQHLDLTVPQAYLYHVAYDEVPRSQWDQGVNASFSNYQISAYGSSENRQHSTYVGLQNGVNIGAWRFRNNSSFANGSNDGGHWNSLSTYVQRDLQPLNAQMVAGRTSTASTLFDSVLMDGIQVFSDDNMLPVSQRGFAPAIHGIANSASQVTIKQNGYIIYQNYVPAGPFTISDLNSLTNGNLEVTVKGADGTTRTFVQSYNSVPGMQREGRWRFSSSFGKYHSIGDEKQPLFFQSQLQYGVNNLLTVYGGTQLSSNYQAVLNGAVVGMDNYGSVSFDLTHARSIMENSITKNGQSARLQYAKSFNTSGTNITLAGYRYSTSGFYDFSEANAIASDEYDKNYLFQNKHSRVQLQVNQPVGVYGSLTFMGYYQNFWNTTKTERNVSVSYNTSVKGIYANINYMESKVSGSSGIDKILSLNFTIPLDKFSSTSTVRYGLLRNSAGDTRNELALNGFMDKARTWQYDVNSAYSNHSDSRENFGGSLSHYGRYGDLSMGYYDEGKYSQANVSFSGAVVAHSGGVTLSRSVGNTFAILHMNNVEDVKVDNYDGIYTDHNGYAIIPNLSTYQMNKISIAANSIPDGFDVNTLVSNVVPTEGASVKAEFGGYKGYQAFIQLKTSKGVIPFGSTVTLVSDKKISGLVDDKGIVYLKGLPAKGVIKSQWGRNADQQCVGKYSIGGNKSPLQQFILTCR